ncbi:MAG: UDP-N-acetylglucosamine 2-epimerase (non-hydrolyzing) [Bacteroidales bacterium]|nr:UDP-N-acetylglucosamine 2-epimerase (non-hydrolyzing) [Bacteroidales bacterium]
MKIISVVGARPNFMKVAPLIRAINRHNENNIDKIEHLLVHTGQHYDDCLSKKIFDELEIPTADINLGVGSGTHAEQVGNSMIALEKVFEKEKPDWVVVYGDVNATMAASIIAKKLLIKVCHVEAGLRSGDWTMPEEINRIVTDRLSDLLLTPDKISMKNLINEGISINSIKFVGNIMIDTLEFNRDKAKKLNIQNIISNSLIVNNPVNSLIEDNYAVMTLHRPSNVDNKHVLEDLVNLIINDLSKEIPIIWAIHPRTQKQLQLFNLWENIISTNSIFVVKPLGYLEMLRLNMSAKIMLTDSGGLQEECTVLGTPCLTMRWNTERPITLKENGGVSILGGNDIKLIKKVFYELLDIKRNPIYPELWDGKTAERCLKEIINFRDVKK